MCSTSNGCLLTIPVGVAGEAGDDGTRGSTISFGAGAPPALTGNELTGDTYIDTTNWNVYSFNGISFVNLGSIQGPAGTGTPGTDGSSVLNGSVDPTGGDGDDGDFWINTTTTTIFGPKTAGVWGSGTSLIGTGTNFEFKFYATDALVTAAPGAEGWAAMATENGNVYEYTGGNWVLRYSTAWSSNPITSHNYAPSATGCSETNASFRYRVSNNIVFWTYKANFTIGATCDKIYVNVAASLGSYLPSLNGPTTPAIFHDFGGGADVSCMTYMTTGGILTISTDETLSGVDFPNTLDGSIHCSGFYEV